MGIVGCYAMDLYCDRCSDEDSYWPGGEVQNYTGNNRADVFRQARADGWLLNPKAEKKKGSVLGSGKALCPKHSGNSAGPGSLRDDNGQITDKKETKCQVTR